MNEQAEWVRHDLTELRIIVQRLWDTTKAWKNNLTKPLTVYRARNARFIYFLDFYSEVVVQVTRALWPH